MFEKIFDLVSSHFAELLVTMSGVIAWIAKPCEFISLLEKLISIFPKTIAFIRESFEQIRFYFVAKRKWSRIKFDLHEIGYTDSHNSIQSLALDLRESIIYMRKIRTCGQLCEFLRSEFSTDSGDDGFRLFERCETIIKDRNLKDKVNAIYELIEDQLQSGDDYNETQNFVEFRKNLKDPLNSLIDLIDKYTAEIRWLETKYGRKI